MKYVLGFIVCRETQEILLIRKLKPEWQKDKLNGIGGKVEDKETPEYAMYREAKEETGLEISKERWINFAVMNCERGSKDGVSDTWSVEVFIAIVDRKLFYQYDSPEAEKIQRMHLYELNTVNSLYGFLGNITWLVGMGIDSIMNNKPFEKVTIEYTGLSKAYQL